MKFFFAFSLFLTTAIGLSQDGISPLTANPDLFSKIKKVSLKSNHSFDSTIYYITDTITLPFFDDFSRNLFQKQTAEIGDTDLSEELYFSMLDIDTEAPLDSDIELTNIQTYRLEYDPIADTTIFYYFDSTAFLYNNLSYYPVNYESRYAYPPFIVYDTLDGSGTKDTIWITEIDYKQDSARIFIKQLNEPDKLWLNEQAYHNYRFAVNPWSLGVVTFDGLDEYGYPYNFGSITNSFNDTLLAKPIDMSSLTPQDSVYFSFLYQTEGFGDIPESNDSLFLEFYSPVTKMWERVWRTSGGPTTDFKVAHIRLINPEYFNKGFQFRFINFSSPAGGLDHFHIDYVNLRPSSGRQDTLFRDFAIVYPISTLLKDYISVPWKHYKASPNGKMSDEVKVTVRNGSVLTENNQNGEVKVYYNGNLESSFVLNASTLSGGNINYAPRTTYESLHDFSSGYQYDPSVGNDTVAYFDYEGSATAQFPNNPINDTTFGRQSFENYYAYDDGTAEKAYGVTGNQGLLAYKFKTYQADSLIGILIHFVPSVVDVSNNLFLLTVWGDDNGKPGNIIYEDEAYAPNQPIYESGRNKFHRYLFKDTMIVPVGETFYIGMRQLNEERLNIGFDMNHDNSDKIFWSVNHGGTWYNASFPGSVMMRPIISSNMNDKVVGVENFGKITQIDYDFNIYPNPTSSFVNIDFIENDNQTQFEIVDLNGRIIKHIDYNYNIDVSSIQSGIYLVKRIENNQIVKVKKLIIQ